MASWEEFGRSEPELAALIKARFDSHKHKMMATLRRDGSPRISGIETTFADGHLWLGMMPGSRKAMDLRRDPRLALHSASLDPDMSVGDAKISGRAAEHADEETKSAFSKTLSDKGEEVPSGPFHLFSVEIAEAVLIRVAGDPPDHLVIETWREGRGLTRVERR